MEYRAGDASPRLQAQVDARRLDLHRLLAGTRASEALKESAGLTGGFAKLRSRGAGLRELLARSSGDVAFFVERGQMDALLFDMLQVDIAGMLGWRGDRATATTPVNCLVSRFALQDGVATAETLLLDTRDGLVAGEGNVNLADETFFLDLKPYPRHASPLRVQAPLQIRGTFAHPQVAPDKVSLAARLGATLGAGALVLPGALLALVDSGLGEQNACRTAFAAQRPAGEGSSTPPSRGR
jgi:uncharacterized protein involved in outer membrane biogenesis